MSGPLLDRLDLHVEVPALRFADLSSRQGGEPTRVVRERVIRARQRQVERAGVPNSRLTTARLREITRLTKGARDLLALAVDRHGLSARAHDRVIKAALTIRDLSAPDDGSSPVPIEREHVAEALAYRRIDEAEGLPAAWGKRAT